MSECTWHYRIVRYADGGYGLHEVYCTDGKPDSWTLEPVGFMADESEGPTGVLHALQMAVSDAAQRPVLQVNQTWAEMCDSEETE